MRLKKKAKSMTSRFTTLVTTVSLFGSSFTPIVAEAQQQQQQQNGGHWVNTVNGLISGFGNMYINMVKQNNAQALAAQQMQSLAPKAVPSKFFPNCPVAQASSNFPEGVCDSISNPGELQTAMSYKSLALTYQGFFEQLGSTAQNTRTPVGLQCLEDNKQYVISSLNDRQNALQSIIDNIKKQAQLFRDQNNASLDQMYELNVELRGIDAARGSSRANPSLAQQDRDFLKYFGEQCQNIIGVKTIQSAREKGGLIAIKDDVQSTNIKAQNFTANSPHFERELNQHIQQMKADVDKYGVEPFMKGSTNANEAELAKFGGIKEVITQKFRNFELNKTSIQKKVTEALPNFNFPEIDKDFEQNFDRFRRSIASFDKGKYINDCITMNSQGYGLTTDQVVKLLRIPGLTTGNSLDYYKDHLTQILDSSSSPEDKLKQIQNINSQGVTITYDSNGKQITTTPYDYYRQIYSTCESLYTQDGTMVINQESQDINNVSNSSKVASVQAYLDELRTMQRNFKEDLGQSIFNKIINCDGRGVTTDTCNSNSNEALFDTTQAGFCVAHAKGCSNDINNCYRQAETRVNERMQVLSNKQAEYNAKVASFVNVQDAILKDLKAKVDADSEYIKRFFPGANYMFPSDMFVSLPEEAMSDFGVMLRGGGSFDFTEELPAKIEKLKEQLREQSSQVASVIDSYISEQESALRDNQSKWDNLKNKCDSAEKSYRQQVAQQNNEAQKAQAEQDQAVGQFCNRFNRLKNMNPAAGCDGANSPEALYEDLSKVSARIDPSVEHRINQYAKLCSQSQSERSKGSEEKSSTPVSNSNTISIADLCTGGSNLARDEIKDMALKNLSAEDKRKAESYIKGDSNELPASLVKNQPAEARILKKLKDMSNASATPVPSQEYFDSKLNGSVSKPDLINKLKLAAKDLGGEESGGRIECKSDDAAKKTACTKIQSWLADGEIETSEISDISSKVQKSADINNAPESALYQALIAKNINKDSFKGVPDDTKRGHLNDMKDAFNSAYPDTETGFCGEFKRLAAQESLDSCMNPSKGTSAQCFKDEFKKNYEDGNLEDIKSLNRSIASVKTSNDNNQWSRLGEQSDDEPCEAQANTARNSFGNFLQNFDASVLGNSNGLNGIVR